MKENPEEQHSSQSDSKEIGLRHKVYRGKATNVALVLFIVGIVFVAWSASVHEEDSLSQEILHHVLRDVGLAAIISAILGSAYEYLLRSDFVDDAEEALGRAVNTERENLTAQYVRDAKTSLIEVLNAQGDFLTQLDRAGLTEIRSGGRLTRIQEKFESIPKRVRILETWTGHRGDGIGDWIHDAIEAGCENVEILLLDPDSRQVRNRARSLNEDDPDEVKMSIKADLAMLEKVRRDHEDNIKIRVYDDSPSVNMFCFDDTRIFGLYLKGLDSTRSPQFSVKTRVSTTDSFIAKELDRHFESLWREALDPRESSKVKALVEEATKEVGTEAIFVSPAYKDGNYLISTGIRVPPSENFTEMVTRTRENIRRVLRDQGVSADDVEITVQGTAS
jgi:hypothetical protein